MVVYFCDVVDAVVIGAAVVVSGAAVVGATVVVSGASVVSGAAVELELAHWHNFSTLHGHHVWPFEQAAQSASVAVWLPGLLGLYTQLHPGAHSPSLGVGELVVSGAAVVSWPEELSVVTGLLVVIGVSENG
jgi:hypothetical protein